jgi:CheY-like chemotaxis protein
VHCVEDINDALQEENGNGQVNTKQIAEALETIDLCILHQKAILDDVLSFSKLESSMLEITPQACQPEQQLRSTLKMFHAEFRKHHIDYEFRVDPLYRELGVDWVMADLARIGQVLINLSSNAIKFMSNDEAHRKITCKVSAVKERPQSYPPEIVFFGSDSELLDPLDATDRPGWSDGDPIFIMVAMVDTGIGISEAGQNKLFERFKQATPTTSEIYGGSGLGLNISRKLVRLHGGDIGIHSNEGSGATFGFFFRVRRTGSPTDDPPSERNKDQKESVESQLQMDGLDKAKESKSKGAQVIHGARLDQREVRPNLSDSLGKCEEDKAKKDSKRTKEKVAQHSGDGSVMADMGRCFALPTTSEEPTEWEEAAERNALLLDSHPNNSEDLQEQQSRKKLGKLPLKTPASSTRRHILLVEDNVINQRVVQRKLFDKDFRVSTANNGREAIEFVTAAFHKENEQNGEAVDMVLMDLEMPVLNGNAAAAQIREIERERRRKVRVPILGVSANLHQEQRQEVLNNGMDGYLTKPYSFEDMMSRIREILGENGDR